MAVEAEREFAVREARVRVRFAGHSDRGAVRAVNEDSFLAAPPFWVVADGMGGHDFGDLASQTAVAAFADRAATDREPTGAGVDSGAGAGSDLPTPRVVLDLVARANERVVDLTDDDTLSGTTLTGVALVDVDGAGPHWMAFNVGDSRTYRWDGRTLAQQSVDHSAVQELVDLGVLTPAEALVHPHRNVVTRALGADDDVEADVWLLPVHGRQTFLLCSDGLTKELDDDEIARIIVFHDTQTAREESGPVLSLAERLVGAAVSAGGRDNVTVVVVESELVGDASEESGDTRDRPGAVLEDTRPRS